MILDESLFEQTEQTQTVYISENAPGMKFIILQDGHFEIEQNGKREHYQTKDIQDLLDVLDSTGFIKETNEDLTDTINQQIDDRNANYEADKQATRDMRQELAKQGIATDINGEPLNEGFEVEMEDLDLKLLYKILKRFPWECRLVEDPSEIWYSHIDLGHPDSESLIHIYQNREPGYNGYFDMYLKNFNLTPQHLFKGDNIDDIRRKVQFLLYEYLRHKHSWVLDAQGKIDEEKLSAIWPEDFKKLDSDVASEWRMFRQLFEKCIGYKYSITYPLDDFQLDYALAPKDAQDKLKSEVEKYLSFKNKYPDFDKEKSELMRQIIKEMEKLYDWEQEGVYKSCFDFEDHIWEQFSDIKYIDEFIEKWKYNDEGFKLVDLLVELRNLLSKSLTESLDQKQFSDNALSGIINALIQDEFDAIQAYNDAIVNFESEGRNDLVQVLHDILNEENLHVGQLETLLKQVSGAANSIDKGQAEAEVQLAQDEPTENKIENEEDPEEGMHY